MFWNYKNIDVFIDLSTYCNAGCPQCHRTSENGLGKAEWLPLIQWDLETFKKAFPVEEFDNIHKISLIGTWGDPVMCKDLCSIIEYVINNSKCKIVINTNGSIRDEEWWWNLGVLGDVRLEVIFDIDGVDQAMHEKYRRFTNLQKVLNNMHSLSQTRSVIKTQTVLFKHNQDYKEEIKALSNEYGSSMHKFVTSDRFDKRNVVDNKRYFINENNEEEYLEKADGLEGGVVPGTTVTELNDKIVCRWAMPRNEILINPDGQVLPCCYHGNAHFKGRVASDSYNYELHGHPVYKEDYNQNLEKYNVFHTPLSQIMKSEWYTKTLPDSIKGNNPIHQCTLQCSNKIKKSHQLRNEVELINVTNVT